MFQFLALLILAPAASSWMAAAVVAQGIPPEANSQVVDLGYARYRGAFNSTLNVTQFLGMQYAAAPVGELRWKAPQHPPPIQGVQNATSQPRACYQAPMGAAAAPGNRTRTSSFGVLKARQDGSSESEDCLYLNVYVPGKVNPQKKLAVVVWIHGGGYAIGNAATYPGEDFVVESDYQLISVIIQYRLGLFGFLSSTEIKDGGNLNAGMLDQEFALNWVQDHIRKFGGDPDKVTIWGQSAGGGSVLQHLVSHGGQATRSLFRAGITSSCYLPPQYAYDDPAPTAVYREVVSSAGCSHASNSLACLRSTDASTLAKINMDVASAALFGTFIFLPVIDGDFLREPITTSLREGRTKGTALLSMTNANEGFMFTDPQANYTAAEYARLLFPRLQEAQVQQVDEAYRGFGSYFKQSSGIMAEAIFVCPTLLLQDSFRKSEKPAWKGQFDISPSIHIQDVFYYFNTWGSIDLPGYPTLPPLFETDHFTETFARSFLSFALSSDPNVKLDSTVHLPDWPEYDNTNTSLGTAPREMYFGQTDHGQHADIRSQDVDTGLLQRCRMWASMTENTHQ